MGVGSFLKAIGRALRDLWRSFLRSFARWADPKLEPYRDKKLSKDFDDMKKPVVVEETLMRRLCQWRLKHVKTFLRCSVKRQ